MHADVIDKLNFLISKISQLNFVNFKKTLHVLAHPLKHPYRDFKKDLKSDPDQLEIVKKIITKFKTLDDTNPECHRDCISEIQSVLEKITKYHVKNAGDLQLSLRKIFPQECKFPTHPSTTSTLQVPRQLETTKKRKPQKDESDNNDQSDQEEARSESVSSRKPKKAKDLNEKFDIDPELDELIHAACQKVPIDENKSAGQFKAVKMGEDGKPTNELKLIILISPPDRYKDNKSRSEFGEKLYNYLIWRCGITATSTFNIAFKPYPLPVDFDQNTNFDHKGRKSFPDDCLFGTVRVRARTIETIKKRMAELIAERSKQKKVTKTAPSKDAPKSASPMSPDSQTEQLSPGTLQPPRAQATSIPKPPPPSSEPRQRDESGKYVSGMSTPPYKSSFNVRQPGPFAHASSPLFRRKPAPSILALPSTDQTLSLTPRPHLNDAPTSLLPRAAEPLPEFRESESPEPFAKPAAAQSLMDLGLRHSSTCAPSLAEKEAAKNNKSFDAAADAAAQAPSKHSPELKKSQESAESAKTPTAEPNKSGIITILDDPDIISLLGEDEELKQQREQADRLFAEHLKAAEAAAQELEREKKASEEAQRELKAAAREAQRKSIEAKYAESEKLRLATEQRLKDAQAQKALTEMYKKKRILLFSNNSANTSVTESPNLTAAPPSTPMQIPTAPTQVTPSGIQTPITPSSPPRQ